MKYLEQSFGGSTESQLSNGGSVSPVMLSKISSVENDETQDLKNKLIRSEQVKHIIIFTLMQKPSICVRTFYMLRKEMVRHLSAQAENGYRVKR